MIPKQKPLATTDKKPRLLGFLKRMGAKDAKAGGEKTENGVSGVVVVKKGPLRKPWKFKFGRVGVFR